ncbi:MAG TPA: hypothetical protein VFX59_10280 [Polyangiales bacterium]|nr:hypothetical protein [Polyangiales bacterium]
MQASPPNPDEARALQAPPDPPNYHGSRFEEVWDAVCSDPYRTLPERLIRVRDVLHPSALARIYRASRRTLRSPADLLPPFEKPVHPLGICLRGRWQIRAQTDYTGMFRAGSEGLLIARASENFGETRLGRLRFLALAGKLYPIADPKHARPLRPANFVMNQNLVGTHTPHYVDANLATDLLPFRMHLDPTPKLIGGLLVALSFAAADRAFHFRRALRRQLYPISTLGERDPRGCRAPQVMRFVPHPDNPRVDAADFRAELARAIEPRGLRYTIEVSDQKSVLRPLRFRAIGEVHFEQAVASFSGDHRLHFHHAAFRSDA